jgi:hypothetical protein
LIDGDPEDILIIVSATKRDIVFAKIRARILGTALAARALARP